MLTQFSYFLHPLSGRFTAGSNQLDGTVPVAFGSIENLEDISLRKNFLTGKFPQELSSLAALTSLDLSFNTISGTLPSFSMLENLATFSLGNNILHGELSFGGMRKLEEFVIENNEFSGRLPDLSDSSIILRVCRLGGNNFDSQPFPEYILGMVNMRNLGLNNLSLTGEIPAGIGTLTSLKILNLEDNTLNGNIPLSIADISPLEEMTIHNNLLSGNIPFEISFLRNLEKFTLSSNRFQSSVPISIGGLTSLKILTMGSNFLSGQLPASMSSLSNLEVLDFGDNFFTGSIPDSIWNTSSLRELILAGNNFVGQIPGSIGNLKKLRVLNIASNTLRGRIPDNIVSLSDLLVLDLSFNFFGGPIPKNIGDLVNLRELLLGTNYDDSDLAYGFDGTIPASIATMKKLEKLQLNRNRISGFLPPQHGLMKSIQTYDVSDNKRLKGIIPTDFLNMAQLNDLKIFGTKIEGSVPVGLCEKGVLIEVDCLGAQNSGISTPTIECGCCKCSQH